MQRSKADEQLQGIYDAFQRDTQVGIYTIQRGVHCLEFTISFKPISSRQLPQKVNYTVIMVAIKSVLLSSAVLLAATAVTAEPIAAPTPAPTPIGHAVEKRADIGEGIDSVISVVTSGAGGVISTITVSFAWHSHC